MILPRMSNFPLIPSFDFSQHSNMMCASFKNQYQHLSYQGTTTLQLHKVYNAVNKKVHP